MSSKRARPSNSMLAYLISRTEMKAGLRIILFFVAVMLASFVYLPYLYSEATSPAGSSHKPVTSWTSSLGEPPPISVPQGSSDS